MLGFDHLSIGPQTENRLKKRIRVWRALHEYVNFVRDPEKQYRSLSTEFCKYLQCGLILFSPFSSLAACGSQNPISSTACREIGRSEFSFYDFMLLRAQNIL